MFYVGQKVVCVDDRIPMGFMDFDAPVVKGRIYTVAGFGTCAASHPGELGVHLAEVIRPSAIPFASRRFRPVVEKKTDISSLVALLNPANHKKLVDA